MTTQPDWFAAALADLVERRDLGAAAMSALMRDMLADSCGEAETAALLIALRMKGETAEELAAAAAVLREHMISFDPGRDDVLDTCGTGGDGLNTFNISTATAFVVAGAGVPVVKHGNRAVRAVPAVLMFSWRSASRSAATLPRVVAVWTEPAWPSVCAELPSRFEAGEPGAPAHRRADDFQLSRSARQSRVLPIS